MDATAIDARVEALETKLSYQERAITELSSELFDVSKRAERAENLLAEMAVKFKELLADSESGAPGNVRPPHW